MTDPMTDGATNAFRWLFEDRRTGKIVIGQTPNLALGIFIGAVVVDVVLKPSSPAGIAVRGIKVASLSLWALDEIVRGVNPWRRILGASAAAYVIANQIG